MAFLFDDANEEYLEVDSVAFTAQPLTLAGWAKRDASPAADLAAIWLGDKGEAAESYSLQIDTDGADALQMRRRGTGGGSAITSTATALNTWHHIMGTANPTGLLVAYLDGEGKGTFGTTGTVTTFDRTAIGRAADITPALYFSGYLAHMAIWNSVLSDGEAILLASGLDPRCIQSGSLQNYWPLGDDASDIVGSQNLTEFNGPTSGLADPQGVPSPCGGQPIWWYFGEPFWEKLKNGLWIPKKGFDLYGDILPVLEGAI